VLRRQNPKPRLDWADRAVPHQRRSCPRLVLGVQVQPGDVYLYERLGGWRRMVSLHMPTRRDALGGPARVQPAYT
jgi:hypothetical protein